MPRSLADVKSAYQGNKEHQVASQSKSDRQPIAVEEFARAAASGLAIFPIVAFAASSGRTPVDGRFAADSGISTLRLDLGGTGECGGHLRLRCLEAYSGFG